MFHKLKGSARYQQTVTQLKQSRVNPPTLVSYQSISIEIGGNNFPSALATLSVSIR